MICINSYLREIFHRVLLRGGNFSDLILDFLFYWYLSLKIWVKPLVSRRSISHHLLCVLFFILTLQGLGRGVHWVKLIFALKLLFCLGGNVITSLKLIHKYFDRKMLLSYHPRVPWHQHLGYMVETLYFKKVTSTKL